MQRSLPYPTRPIQLNIHSHQFNLLEVSNSEELLDELVSKGEDHEDLVDERIPYWTELWPSALGLAQFILRHEQIQAGQKVLELGCGLGLPGIAAGHFNAQVTLSDYLEPALSLAKKNWELNHRQEVKLALLDWREPQTALAADWLLASDITYEEKNFPYLPKAFHKLCRPGGKIILSDPKRAIAQDFFHKLPTEGFQVEKFEEMVFFQNKSIKINIYMLKV